MTAMAKDKDEEEENGEKNDKEESQKDDNQVNPYNRPEINELEQNK